MESIIESPQDQKSNINQVAIKVIGLGGAGCNTINHIMECNLNGVECIAANTDLQVLYKTKAHQRIQLGPMLTKGLGAGGDPKIGGQAAEESQDKLFEILQDAKIVFLSAGMGGGTGTGSIPIVAQLAQSIGAIVISIVSTPFSFESGKRQQNAQEGLACLRSSSDTLIVIPNDRLLQIAPEESSVDRAFRLADDVLRQAIQAISELVTQPGLINVDFAHVLRIMKMGGGTYLGIGHSQGDHKAIQAIQQALHHPLLEEIHLNKARGAIVHFSGGAALTMGEVVEALNIFKQKCHPDTEVIPGLTSNPLMHDKVQVIIMITGIDPATPKNPIQAAALTDNHASHSHIDKRKRIDDSDKIIPQINDLVEELEIPTFIRRKYQLSGINNE